MIYWRDYVIRRYRTYTYKHDRYLDVTMAMDTETTSYYQIDGVWRTILSSDEIDNNTPRRALVYIWQLGINSDVVYGRDIRDYVEFLRLFSAVNPERKIIYVHNLGYDFSFFCEYYANMTVFARRMYTPIKSYEPCDNVEYRCSYYLTNMSLDQCAKQYRLSVRKLTGTLDYTLARTPNTDLSDTELAYCEHDIKVIIEMIDTVYKPRYKVIANIPLTQTGEVRREVKHLLSGNAHMQLMRKCKPDLRLYSIMTRVLAGGYTHLNPLYCCDIVEGLQCYDRASSYPAEMVLSRYPVTPFAPCNDQVLMDDYAYIMQVTITNITSRSAWSYLSRHKCDVVIDGVVDNGKVARATSVTMWITDVDLDIIKMSYHYATLEIHTIYRSRYGRLPTPLVRYILDRYEGKTTLKGLDDQYALYMHNKQLINATYGMTCTGLIHPEILYNNCTWSPAQQLSLDDEIAELNKARPFMCYAWGIWTTAGARRVLWSLISRMGNDCVYCDTDSVKFLGNYSDLISKCNNTVLEQIAQSSEYHNIPISKYMPIDSNGIEHPIGVFEDEGTYDRFRSLGAKKYIYEQGGNTKYVVAGLIKRPEHNITVDNFADGMIVPNARMIHWYVQDMPEADITDYQGHVYHATNTTGIVMANAAYTFGRSGDYKLFVTEVRDRFRNIFRLSEFSGQSEID